MTNLDLPDFALVIKALIVTLAFAWMMSDIQRERSGLAPDLAGSRAVRMSENPAL
ncbi:MAG: hypothetical protein ABSA02_11160 [Trebonia sp.]